MEKKVWRYKFLIETGYVGANHEDVFEFDHLPDEYELEATMEDFIQNTLSTSWTEIED